MPAALDFSIPPVEHLTAEERRKLAAAADIAFLQPGEVLIRAGEAPAHLYLIVKGVVSERAGGDVITVHGAGDLVDAGALAAPAPATAEIRRETLAQLRTRRSSATTPPPGACEPGRVSRSRGRVLRVGPAATVAASYRTYLPVCCWRAGPAESHDGPTRPFSLIGKIRVDSDQ